MWRLSGLSHVEAETNEKADAEIVKLSTPMLVSLGKYIRVLTRHMAQTALNAQQLMYINPSNRCIMVMFYGRREKNTDKISNLLMKLEPRYFTKMTMNQSNSALGSGYKIRVKYSH